MAGECARIVAVSLLGIILQLAGLVLFVLGFFPVKPALMGISDSDSVMPGCHTSNNSSEVLLSRLSQVPYQEASGMPRQYERLVVMVVDGMPAEFLLGRGGRPPPAEVFAAMPFTHNLLSAGKAIGYHAKAAPPTVTMPRLKAMTSGAIAGFLDVAFNFNTQALLGDNLICQLSRAGWKMVMLGDETWLKLFPNIFMRHDGVSSFYVKDTEEVDYNVTRHLEVELAATDWDLLVLHYLGLDHVGHLGGRSSSLVASKLKEMDGVIQRIHEQLSGSLAARRTLLMVGSDHGMTDGGNHGGASYQEVDALAMFVPGEETDSKADILSVKQSAYAATSSAWSSFQVDVVPTLALMLGVPIPKNSVGVLLPQLFTTLSPKQQLRALELNAWQLFRLVRVRSPRSLCVNHLCLKQPVDTVGGAPEGAQLWGQQNDKVVSNFCDLFTTAIRLHKVWRHRDLRKPKSEENLYSDFEAAREAYLDFLKPTSEWLSRGTTELNRILNPSDVNGTSSLRVAVKGPAVFSSDQSARLVLLYRVLHGIYQDKLRVTQGHQTRNPNQNRTGDFILEKIVAVGGVCIHAGSLASSSFVEEEQFTWHFLVTSLSLAFLRRSFQHQGSLHSVDVWQLSRQERKVLDGFQPLDRAEIASPAAKPISQDVLAQVLALAGVLLVGGLLRTWHRSGVNWTHLPDIAKWIDSTDLEVSIYVRCGAICFVTTISVLLILSPTQRHLLQRLLAFCMCISALLIFVYTRLTAKGTKSTADTIPTQVARAVFGVLGFASLSAFLLVPWTIPMEISTISTLETNESIRDRMMGGSQRGTMWEDFPLEAWVQAAMQSVGHVLISCWCLLQLLLQQSVNAGPVALLMGQLVFMITFFRRVTCYDHWLPVLMLLWMGASGHYGLGNSNTLATVDVAGAYIGLSSHSTIRSGLLAFFITYAAPLLFMLGMLLLTSPLASTNTRSSGLQVLGLSEAWLFEALAVPCLLPLALNGVILLVFTVVLILMQNHLFVWSVFSPKYLYICAATACTTLGTLIFVVTFIYSTLVIMQRAHWLRSRKFVTKRS